MKINQSGRSMVEMLGVLAIVGVLSIGGLTGYTYIMNRYRANKIIDIATKIYVISRSLNAFSGGRIVLYDGQNYDDLTWRTIAGVTGFEGVSYSNVSYGIVVLDGVPDKNVESLLQSLTGYPVVYVPYKEKVPAKEAVGIKGEPGYEPPVPEQPAIMARFYFY